MISVTVRAALMVGSLSCAASIVPACKTPNGQSAVKDADISASNAAASQKTFCGVRSGTAGNASLDDNDGQIVILLATQGGDQTLLDQADSIISGGTQNGSRYCVDAAVDATGKPTKIVGAARVQTYCGVRSGTAGNASLDDDKGRIVIVLATQGGDQTLLDQTDGFISGGMQNGSSYCIDAKVDAAAKPAKIVGAYHGKTYCGIRSGTAGNASLHDANGQDVIVLATQGGDQTLLDQTDRFIADSSNSGTQNGTSYCVNAEINSNGKPVAITGAVEQGAATAGSRRLPYAHDMISALASAGVSDCGTGKCYYEVSNVTCKQSGDGETTSYSCSLTFEAQGTKIELDSAKAQALWNSMKKNNFPGDGAAGSYYFSADHIKCTVDQNDGTQPVQESCQG
jgi:hypothetical protein